MVSDLDALYVNFISGFEMCMGTAQALRQGFRKPIYADLHSLFLGMQHDGIRTLQPLRDPEAWFGCFDVVQMNEEEMQQISRDPLTVAAQAMAQGVKLLAVTLGPRGVVYVAATRGGRVGGHPHGARSPPRTWPIPTPPAVATCSAPRSAPTCWPARRSRRRCGARWMPPRATRRSAGARGLAQHLRGELVTP